MIKSSENIWAERFILGIQCRRWSGWEPQEGDPFWEQTINCGHPSVYKIQSCVTEGGADGASRQSSLVFHLKEKSASPAAEKLAPKHQHGLHRCCYWMLGQQLWCSCPASALPFPTACLLASPTTAGSWHDCALFAATLLARDKHTGFGKYGPAGGRTRASQMCKHTQTSKLPWLLKLWSLSERKAASKEQWALRGSIPTPFCQGCPDANTDWGMRGAEGLHPCWGQRYK